MTALPPEDARPPTPPVADTPSVARMYDRLLGGAHNFGPDRDQVAALASVYPRMEDLVRSNRSFLRHAVEHALGLGIDQFLDLGSGIPTVGNVHEIARRHDPDTRVAYVDHDPTAVAHSRTLLADVANATMTEADLRDASCVLAAPGVAGLLDLSRPVALLALSVLHFADDPVGVLTDYRGALAPGSLVALTHTSDDYPDHPELVGARREIVELYAATGEVVHDRSRPEIRAIAESAGFPVGPRWPVDLAEWAPARYTGGPLGGYALISGPLP